MLCQTSPKPITSHSIKKIGSIQYNAAIAATGTVRGTLSEKLY